MKSGSFKQWLIAAVLAVMTAGGVVAYKLWSGPINDRIQALITGLQSHGPAGWGMVALIQAAIAISGLLPAAAMGVAAGAIYGTWLGFALTAVGTLLGATVAFLLARSLFRPLIQGYLLRKPYMARLDSAIATDGWRTVCLLRMSPVMPFAAGSYALGLTSIRFSHYLLGSLAALPALLGYVFLGHLARQGFGDATHGTGLVHLAFLGIGIIATLFLVLHLGRLAKRVGLTKSSFE